jgi:23S rRNA pseudouridine2605 synthase
MMEERLQKLLARAGVSSRRKAEDLIAEGRVTVNGVVARELGSKADLARDEVRVDGELIARNKPHVYIMLHKPEGYVTTTSDPEGRPTVMHLVKRTGARVFPVGRLDYATSGLLLLTTDGDLAQFLTRPRSHVAKTYQVKVRERVSQQAVKALAHGPQIGGPRLKPSRVKFTDPSRSGRHSWLEITITEGRTRQIRRMCEAVGHPVIKLKRVTIGTLHLGQLPVGQWRRLKEREVERLLALMNQPADAKDRLR